VTLPGLMEPFPAPWDKQSVLLQSGAQKAHVVSTASNRQIGQ
jgi:hypothetical protein